MNKLEKRIMQVSEMLSENFMEAALDFRHNTAQTSSLSEAQDILDPTLEHMSDCLAVVINKHGLNDALINDIRRAESVTAYTIGIVAGLHLAGRTDLLSRFANAYAVTTGKDHYNEYDEDGRYVQLIMSNLEHH